MFIKERIDTRNRGAARRLGRDAEKTSRNLRRQYSGASHARLLALALPAGRATRREAVWSIRMTMANHMPGGSRQAHSLSLASMKLCIETAGQLDPSQGETEPMPLHSRRNRMGCSLSLSAD